MNEEKPNRCEEELAAAIGIDWSDRKHDMCLMDLRSNAVEFTTVEQKPEDLHEWIVELRERFNGRSIAICLEQSRGALINTLMTYDFFVLYPINPNTLNRYREAFATSKAKDDPSDAYLLMELVTKHRDKLHPWYPDDELTRSIGILAEARRKAVNLRTRLSNRLRAVLKTYYPQALQLTGTHLHSIMACDFLLKWSTLAELKKADAQTIRKFYYGHHSRRGDLIERRLELIKKTSPLTTDKAINETSSIDAKMLANQLHRLSFSLRQYDKEIKKRYAQHPDNKIFSSLPGSGAVLAPRLLAAFGADRDRFESAEEIQKYSGIAPVTIRSGKMKWVQMRWACPKYLRQSFHEFANHSIKFSMWARAYYEHKRARGKEHHAAIRALAFKWIRIIFCCWKTKKSYDELKYLKALRRSGSSLLVYMPETA